MRTNQCVGCQTFPCGDVRHEGYIVPDLDIAPENISVVIISEAAPPDAADYYYAGAQSLFQQTTLLAFQDAGIKVTSFKEILDLGVYLTTAVKCAKTGYAIQTITIDTCSHILESELSLFPNVKVFLLMGDVAIRAVNAIAKRNGQARVIPAGSTYKLRGQAYYFLGKRTFPSYLQAGPSFFIEKSKRKMIAEDIRAAFQLID
jgi:uracil-DNA glycosylase